MYLFQKYGKSIPESINDVRVSPLLAETGMRFEIGQIRLLQSTECFIVGPADHDLTFDATWSGEVHGDHVRDLVDSVLTGERESPVVGYQPTFEEAIEAWPVRGDADGVLVSPTTIDGEAGVEVRVLEMKSSTESKTHHQIQAAMYALLLRQLLGDRNVEVTASVVTRGNSFGPVVAEGLNFDLLADFELESRINDVRLLFERGGTLDRVLLDQNGRPPGDGDVQPPRYRIDERCDGCPKQAKCVARGATTGDLSLLGFSEGVQEGLQEFGIDGLDDLVDLYELPTGRWDRTPTRRSLPEASDPGCVAQIQSSTELSRLYERVQIAHRFRREIDPEFERRWRANAEGAGPWQEYLVGSGRNLPDDCPPESYSLEYPRESLVRVYPYVQHDHVRNRLCILGAKVDCTRHDGDGEFVIAITDVLVRDTDAKDEVEKDLLAEFIEKLESAIGRVRPDLSDEGIRPEEGLLHMYPYSERQREWLVDATRRHEGDPAADAIRTLLGYRQDIDQEIVSVLREEFRARHAFRYPGLGLFQTVAQFYDISKERDFGWEDVRDETETPLKQVFDLGFFEVAFPVERFGDRIIPKSDEGFVVPPDRFHGHYPVVERHRDTMPLEYLYAAEEFDVLDEEWSRDEAALEEIMRYRHHHGAESSRVSLSDIEDLIHAICNAVEFIERCIRYKDAGVTKEPINLESLTANSLGESALQRTLVEYQQLEHGSKRRALEHRYRQPLAERVAAGQTIPFEVTNPPENRENHEKKNTAEGEILRSLGNGQPGITAATTLRRESGNWVVLTPLVEDDDGRLIEKPDDPTKYANGVLGRLSFVDGGRGEVQISFPTDSNRRAEPNMTNHVGWTSDPDDERQLIAEGMTFAVNEAVDDYSAYRAREAIDNADENVLHNELLEVYAEENPNALRFDEPFRHPDAVEAFLEQFDAAMLYETNNAQQRFVCQLDHAVGSVQGPPGTGKTAYASTPAILSRVATTPDGERFLGVASAHSNTAVDEVAKAVGDATARLAETGAEMDVTLVRVRASSAESTDLPDNVHDLQYYEDSDELEELLAEPLSEGSGKVVVFATPVTLRNMVNTVATLIGDGSNVSGLLESGDAAVFDYALVDEASMMDLPLLFLVGAFLREGSQIQLVGDHRQMQPIRAHDWESEDRATIEEHTPAVSALDFVRFLRGETDRDLATVEREPPEWDDADQVIPMERLTVTYRLPPAMAEFETDLFYYRDGIELTSRAEARQIPDVRNTAMPAWLRAALDPEPRVTLLLHDDQHFTKDSPVEAYLAQKMLSALPVMASDPGEGECSAGVVVPFRLMRRRLYDQAIGVPVDTVERYQGDEKDVMVLAMTAGNQGYVNGLAEFLLDANRFNVGASRMKRKLFIVASKSIFRAVANDVDEYEDQKAWKQLYRRLGVANSPDPPSVTLTRSEVGGLDYDESVTVEVYTGFRD